jgi:hypothetical protein
MTDPAHPHRSSEDEQPDDRPEFGDLAKRPSIADLQRHIAPDHATPPRRLTDAEITVQHAGYWDFNAIESMACELREHRRNESVLLEIAAAALELKRCYGSPELERGNLTVLFRALSKVRS